MFGRRHPEEDESSVQPSEPGIREALGPEMTVVGRGAQLEGTLESVESIRIDGEAKGRIAARGDVILTSHSHVEADIRAQNVVPGGTLRGNITARTRTELAQGGMEGTIRSKVLVVREGALFSGQASIDLEDAPGKADGSAYPEDELQTGYEDAVRRAAEWYRSSLWADGGAGSQRRAGARRPRHLGAGRGNADRGDRSRPFAGLTLSASTDRAPRRDADIARYAPRRKAKQPVSLAWVGLRCGRGGRRYPS